MSDKGEWGRVVKLGAKWRGVGKAWETGFPGC